MQDGNQKRLGAKAFSSGIPQNLPILCIHPMNFVYLPLCCFQHFPTSLLPYISDQLLRNYLTKVFASTGTGALKEGGLVCSLWNCWCFEYIMQNFEVGNVPAHVSTLIPQPCQTCWQRMSSSTHHLTQDVPHDFPNSSILDKVLLFTWNLGGLDNKN